MWQFRLARFLVGQHAEIVDRIEVADPAGAASAMRTDVRDVLRDLPRFVERNPEYFDRFELDGRRITIKRE